jgi:hypothetical protein
MPRLVPAPRLLIPVADLPRHGGQAVAGTLPALGGFGNQVALANCAGGPYNRQRGCKSRPEKGLRLFYCRLLVVPAPYWV